MSTVATQGLTAAGDIISAVTLTMTTAAIVRMGAKARRTD